MTPRPTAKQLYQALELTYFTNCCEAQEAADHINYIESPSEWLAIGLADLKNMYDYLP